MQIKLLKIIVNDVAGIGAEKIVDLLFEKNNVNEFIIAKKMDLTINQTRNILYKLGDQGIVSFVRKKDKKKGGWYTYFWTIQKLKCLKKLRGNIISEVQKFESQLDKRESKRFYHCKNCDLEFNEEESLLQDYTCPECGEILEIKETGQIISHIKGEIDKNKKLLEEVNVEIEILAKKEQKSKERRQKAEKKKKDEERRKRRAKTMLEKKEAAKLADKGKDKKSEKKKKKKKKVKPKLKVKRKPLKKALKIKVKKSFKRK